MNISEKEKVEQYIDVIYPFYLYIFIYIKGEISGEISSMQPVKNGDRVLKTLTLSLVRTEA